MGDSSGQGAGAGAGRSGPFLALGEEESRALLADLFRASAAGLAILAGDELRFLHVNPAYRALLPDPGLDPEGRGFLEVWPVDADVADELRGVLATGQPAHVEDLPVRAPGGPRWLSSHVQRIAYGGRPALLAAVWETTAFVLSRRSAEEALRHALGRAAELDAVLDAIADGFLLFDARGQLLRTNAASDRFFEGAGIPPRAGWADAARLMTLRTPDGRVVPPERWPAARALAGETVGGAHLRVETPGTGRSSWMLGSAAPVRGPDGRVAGAVVTFSDETALHALEEARDDLVRMISHDLRTPLHAVYTQAHLLRRDPGDASKVEDRARSIIRSCERMSGMIQDLVEGTLLEAGQLSIVPMPVDLAATAGELVERLRGGLDVERIRVTVAEALPPVAADPPRLERILVNLLTNALKYSPPASPIDLVLAPAAGGCRVSITDRGVGIAPEDLAHVFDRFYRARGQRRPEGLGLGLYITRLLVEAHGGHIEVESALGQGSTFHVFLPAAPAGAVVAPPFP